MYGNFLNFEKLYLLHFRVLYIFQAMKHCNAVVFLHFTVKMNGIYRLTLNTHFVDNPTNFGGLLLLHTHVKYPLCHRFDCQKIHSLTRLNLKCCVGCGGRCLT